MFKLHLKALLISLFAVASIYSQERRTPGQKTVLVCGAGGFIGSHLVDQYKREGYWVRGVDIKLPEFRNTSADEFLLLDLRDPIQAEKAVSFEDRFKEPFDEVCQLAAEMGGLGFIFGGYDAQIMRNSVLINVNVIEACHQHHIPKILFTSSLCIYPEHNQMDPLHANCSEESAYPANPNTEYGWEKLFSERLYQAYAREYKMDIRIVRLHNTFGPYGTWKGGREKAPAALCRKIAAAKDGDVIPVWGQGNQTRPFLYIDECIEGLRRIMQANETPPIVNLGPEEMIAINDLAIMIARIAGKNISIKNIIGPEGVKGRGTDNRLIRRVLGWAPSPCLEKGIRELYSWVDSQVIETGWIEKDVISKK